jgi:2-polyprenyl-3-methyl-5-hydroxy-6-metoxy-1,4-benzoquinol methylase
MNKADFIRSPRAYLPVAAQRTLLALPGRCRFLLDHTGAPPQRVLDVGCATGYIAALLMRMGHRVTGIELNPRMAAEARSLGVEVIEHDLEEPLPQPDATVDVVHACEIIEHLFDTEGFLRELHRVLVPKGVLILSTPNLNSIGNRWRVLTGRPLPMWGAYPEDRHGGHVRVLNRAKVEELLRRTGFRPEVITGINQRRLTRWLDRLPTLSEMLLIKAVKEEAA